MPKVITISREFGSGGRELGKWLAHILEYRYIDNEIIEALARETNLNEDYLHSKSENGLASPRVTLARSFSQIQQMSN